MPAVATLLSQPSLGLSKLCGDEHRAFQAVRLADEPADAWRFAPGDLRLTEQALAPEQMHALFQSAPAAVGYALTPRRRAVPDGLLTLAQAQGTVLFTLPPTLSLERLRLEAVRLLTEEHLAALNLTATVQGYVLETLRSPKPERDLLKRLHDLTGANFVLHSTWGSVIASAGERLLLDVPTLLDRPTGPVKVGGRYIWLVRLETAGRLHGFLGVTNLAKVYLPLLDMATGVLTLSASRQAQEVQAEQHRRDALFNSWLAGSDPQRITERLQELGFGPELRYTVVVAAPTGLTKPQQQRRREHAVSKLQAVGDHYFLSLAVPALSIRRPSHCAWAYAGDETQVEPLYKALSRATGVPCRLGSSLPTQGVRGLTTAYHQADVVTRTTAPSGYAFFSQLDPLHWTLEQQPTPRLHALHDGLVGALKQADKSGKLWRTLKAYLASTDSLEGLASTLHIHVNTLRYRLGKIESLLGLPLNRPESLARLYLAVQLEAVLSASDSGSDIVANG